MKYYLSRCLMFCSLILFLNGCATTTPFIYDHPKTAKPVVTELKIAITYPKDEREPNKEVDKMWSKNPVEDVAKVLEDEIRSTGLFRETVLINKGEDEKTALNAVHMVLKTSLKELTWEIPNLKEQENKALVVSILTGGIGGLIYGSGSTDFYGKAKLRVILENREKKEVLLDKEYFSRAEEKMTRLKTDSAEERARIIGKAVKQVVDQLKADLEQAVEAKIHNSQ
jgi:hypothetical protein